MGTTIRREPIVNKIPANPDYQYQNILDFQGISISSNPFETDPNTASDSLNVYVDEDNALATRPRLNKKYNFKEILDSSSVIDKAFNVHNGYLVFSKYSPEYYRRTVKFNTIRWNIEIDDPDGMWYSRNHAYYTEDSSTGYVLNKDTMEWEDSQIAKDADFSLDIWHVGTKTYCGDNKVLLESNGDDSAWGTVDWYITESGVTSSFTDFTPRYMWTDVSGKGHYYDTVNDRELILNEATNTWSVVDTRDLCPTNPKNIWSTATNTYYSNGTEQWVLDPETNTWRIIEWIGYIPSGITVYTTSKHTYAYNNQTIPVRWFVLHENEHRWEELHTEEFELDVEDPWPAYGKLYFNDSSEDDDIGHSLVEDLYIKELYPATLSGTYYVTDGLSSRNFIEIILPRDYKSDPGILTYYEESENGLMPHLVDNVFTSIITNIYDVFEQNDDVYLLTNDGLYKIADYKLNKVDGYIPTTVEGKYKKIKESDGTYSYDNTGTEYESINLLSDYYKETYFWDGSWDISKEIVNAVDVKNDYIKNTITEIKDVNGAPITGTCIRRLIRPSIDSKDRNYYFCRLDGDYDYNNVHFYFVATTKDDVFVRDDLIPVNTSSITIANETPIEDLDCSDDGTAVVCISSYGKYLFGRESIVSSDWTAITISLGYDIIPFDDGLRLHVSSDGLHASFILQAYPDRKLFEYKRYNKSSNWAQLRVTDYDVNESLLSLAVLTESSTTPDPPDIYHKTLLKITAVRDQYGETDLYGQNNDDTEYSITPFWNTSSILGTVVNMALYKDTSLGNNSYSLLVSAKLKDRSTGEMQYAIAVYNRSGSTGTWTEINYSKDASHVATKLIFNDETRAYFSNADGSWAGLIDLSANTLASGIILSGLQSRLPSINANKIYGPINTSTLKFAIDIIDLTAADALIVVTRKIDYDTIEDFEKIKGKLKTAKIQTRFDNNIWLASDNYTFHSLYNDPTYFPFSEYNSLGEDFDPITSFNQISDSVLMAYKTQKLYIITPRTVGDDLTYQYTETKSLEGNIPINAAIVTVLNEYPTFVNYNGIFALSQLENVQSSDHIASLLSEPINPKWLKEPKECIDNCVTFNRLYWTYYLLPDKIVDEETGKVLKHYTKVYLFDNRKNSWFYWELPVHLLTAFTKNYKSTFVSKEGEIYTLETTDLPNEYNPDITEYYDYGQQLIRWYWKSQKLPLKTINYAKKLIDTTFILTDTDVLDGYALNYNFTAYRKTASETYETTISDNLNYVQSTTKRTMIPKFNFIQLKISNVDDDDRFDNNKLRLVGIALKYVLLHL